MMIADCRLIEILVIGIWKSAIGNLQSLTLALCCLLFFL